MLKLQPDGKKFLKHFPSAYKGAIGSKFLAIIRSRNIENPNLIIKAILEKYRDYQNLGQLIKNNYSEAIEMCKYFIAWEQLTPSQKDQIKQQKSKDYFQKIWSNEVPTGKQKKYLHNLNYIGKPPGNKLEACQIIDQLLKAKDWKKGKKNVI